MDPGRKLGVEGERKTREWEKKRWQASSRLRNWSASLRSIEGIRKIYPSELPFRVLAGGTPRNPSFLLSQRRCPKISRGFSFQALLEETQGPYGVRSNTSMYGV